MKKYFSPIPSWSIQLIVLIALNVTIFLHIPFISSFAGFVYLFLFPGFVLIESLQIRYKSFWPRMLHMVALSVVIVLFGGLLANTIMPWLGNIQPLGFKSILFIFDLILLSIIIFNYFFRKNNIVLFKLNFAFLRSIKYHLLPGLFPIVAIMGATILNNGGSNNFVLALIASIVIFVLVLFFIKRDIPESFLQSSLYFIALALLLMTSMRSWHITGYDIHQEFRIFQLTKNDLFWTMKHLQDSYNACLSITILPTIISQFTHLLDEYIYKFLYQIIFAIMPIAVYQFVRHFGNKKTAFLATFFLIVQPWFFFSMPTLNRQEFGLLFFSLVLWVLFDETIKNNAKFQLAVLYGAAMVVSHYSTTYIAVALLLLAYGMNNLGILILFRKKYFKSMHQFRRCISLPYILMLFVIVFSWNALITNTSENFEKFIDQSSSNFGQVFAGDAVINSINRLFYPNQIKIDVMTYLQNNSDDFRKDHPELQYYSNQNLQEQSIQAVSFQQVPSYFGDKVNLFAATIFKFLKILVNNIFIIIGVCIMFYYWLAKKFKWNELIFLSSAGFILLALLLLMPDALQEYNLERLYFQLLIIWSFASVLGGIFIFKFIRKSQYSYQSLAAIFCLLLMFYSGFIFNFTGGPAFIALNNYGGDYEMNYTHEAEVKSAEWLRDNHGAFPIYTNSPGRNKLQAFGNFYRGDLISDTYPAVISKKSYVYLTYMNTVGHKGAKAYIDNEYAYTYPMNFLEENKNKIYSNGISQIYR